MSDVSTNIRKRKKYEFRSIRLSESFKALNSLPDLTPSQQLTQDAIFKVVWEEIRQVRLDITTINSIILEDIKSESLQTDRINRQLKSSIKKVDHNYSKTLKLRRKHDQEIHGQLKVLSETLDFVDNSLTSLRQSTTEIIESMVRMDSELPSRNRSINEQLFNEQHYPLLFQRVRSDHPDIFQHENQGSAYVTLDKDKNIDGPQTVVDIPEPDDTRQDSIVNTDQSDDARQVQELEELISNYKLSRQKKHQVSDSILMPRFQKVSTPSISTSFDQAEFTEPFSAKR